MRFCVVHTACVGGLGKWESRSYLSMHRQLVNVASRARVPCQARISNTSHRRPSNYSSAISASQALFLEVSRATLVKSEVREKVTYVTYSVETLVVR